MVAVQEETHRQRMLSLMSDSIVSSLLVIYSWQHNLPGMRPMADHIGSRLPTTLLRSTLAQIILFMLLLKYPERHENAVLLGHYLSSSSSPHCNIGKPKPEGEILEEIHTNVLSEEHHEDDQVHEQ